MLYTCVGFTPLLHMYFYTCNIWQDIHMYYMYETCVLQVFYICITGVCITYVIHLKHLLVVYIIHRFSRQFHFGGYSYTR